MKPLSLPIILLTLIIPVAGCSVPTAKTVTTITNPQKVKADVKKFEDAIALIEKPTTAAQEKLEGLMKEVKTQGDLVELVGVARQTKRIFDESLLKVTLIDISDNLPTAVKEALKEAKSNTQLALSYRSDALGSLLKFLDDQKPSLMADYKNQSEQANNAYVAASIALAQAYSLAVK